MPELPEVEVVRRGLDRWISGRALERVEVLHPRAVRRHVGGDRDLVDRLAGCTIRCVSRRGKYLWFPLSENDSQANDEALVGHLGMSGQLLVEPASAPDEKHLRVRMVFDDGGPELRFVDQRTFGGMALEPLVPVVRPSAGPRVVGPVLSGAVPDEHVPRSVAHIARDPLDPRFDDRAFIVALRARRTGLKRALLDQTLISGVGNIYADEALWRAHLHYAKASETVTPAVARVLLGALREVMNEALAAGGTSFDSLYVNVNGASGYFDRSLSAYGQHGRPCPRCGTPIVRESFMNRSSHRCPRCQRTPRNARL